MIDAEIVIAACTVTGLAGSAAGWFGRHFTIKPTNGNGHLTKEDHELLCQPMKQQLADGSRQFEEIKSSLDMILNAMINKKN